MKEPTEAQIKELWEWCGLKWFWNHNPACNCGAIDDVDSERSWYYKVDGEWELASNFYHEKMDDVTKPEFMGYLFKYAVPKLRDVIRKQCNPKDGGRWSTRHFVRKVFSEWLDAVLIRGKDPSLALFWAIYKVIK